MNPASNRRYRGWRAHGETYVYAFDTPDGYDEHRLELARDAFGKVTGGALIMPPLQADPLPLRLDLVSHSASGFEWGYGGAGPSQLALAILADHWRADARPLELRDSPFRSPKTSGELFALEHHQELKCLVGRLEGDAWEMTAADVDLALELAVELAKPGMRDRASKALDALARHVVMRASALGGPCSECGHMLEQHEGSPPGGCIADHDSCSCSSYRPWPAHVPISIDPAHRGGGVPVATALLLERLRAATIDPRHEDDEPPPPLDAQDLADLEQAKASRVALEAAGVLTRGEGGMRFDVDRLRKLVKLGELVQVANQAAAEGQAERDRIEHAAAQIVQPGVSHLAAALHGKDAERPIVVLAAMLRDHAEQVSGWSTDDTDAGECARFRRVAEYIRAAAGELEQLAAGGGKDGVH